MSRPRYDWWGYVKGMIRRYPALCRQYWDLHSQSVTALYGPQGGAGERRRGLLRPGVDHHAADRLIEPVYRINFAMQPQ